MQEDSVFAPDLAYSSALTWGISASTVSSSVLISQVSTEVAEFTLTDLRVGVLALCTGRRPEDVVLTFDTDFGEEGSPPDAVST